MKKLILFPILVISVVLFGQEVERDMVVVEIATGTWCYYCPGAAMGADDLVANGHDVAVVEYHDGDPFANSYSNARISYYNVSGFPTAKFDGILTVVGGNHTQSMYGAYLPKVNYRESIPSSFNLMIFGEPTGADYDIMVVANKAAPAASTNMVLHFVLTESHIAYNWQGMSEVNFVERIMVPNQNGTSLDFSGGDTQIIDLSFTMNGSWVPEQCELVAFIQDTDNKEILQGTKVKLMDLTAGYANNAAVESLTNVPYMNCAGAVSPVFSLVNMGIEPLTSADIKYQVNDESEMTYNWTGNLALLESEQVELPEAGFDVLPQNTLKVYSTNPNGNPDEDPTNDTVTTQFIESESTVDVAYLMIKLDNMPEETTWELLDSNNDVVYSGGPYPGQPMAFVKDTLEFDQSECYTFIIYDDGGNGLCCENGEGFYRITDESNVLIYTNNEFGHEEMIQFYNDHLIGIQVMETPDVMQVFPNPFRDETSLQLTLSEQSDVEVAVYNMAGEQIISLVKNDLHAGNHKVKIESEAFGPGIYFVKVNTGNTIITRKITAIR